MAANPAATNRRARYRAYLIWRSGPLINVGTSPRSCESRARVCTHSGPEYTSWESGEARPAVGGWAPVHGQLRPGPRPNLRGNVIGPDGGIVPGSAGGRNTKRTTA